MPFHIRVAFSLLRLNSVFYNLESSSCGIIPSNKCPFQNQVQKYNEVGVPGRQHHSITFGLDSILHLWRTPGWMTLTFWIATHLFISTGMDALCHLKHFIPPTS
jgi:hypothetical protein